jgi:hypothetical protein
LPRFYPFRAVFARFSAFRAVFRAATAALMRGVPGKNDQSDPSDLSDPSTFNPPPFSRRASGAASY